MAEKSELLQIRKWHGIIGILMAIMVPTVSVVAAYYSNKTAVKDMVHQVEKKMSEQNLENEKRFAKNKDIKGIEIKINKVLPTKSRL